MRSAMRVVGVAATLAAMITLTASPAAAQYFGRNKVQYETFDFEKLETEHFDIYFYPEEREGADLAARMAERWLARLQRVLEYELQGRQPLVLYAAQPHFQQTNAIGGEIGEGTGGVTESMRRRIILPMGGPLEATDHVIGHELVHAFQFDMTSRQGGSPGETGAQHLPLWFVEGMAEYLSIGPIDAHTAMWLRDAVREEELPNIEDLDNPQYFPYRWGQAFWAYVAGRWGDSVVSQMLMAGGDARDYHVAIEQVLGLSVDQLSEDWHSAIRSQYVPIVESTTPPSEVGKRLLAPSGGLGGDLNVSPALSPDGRFIAFLSERSLFSIDLFVADATTGEVVHRLTSTASDPHLASLQFIHSAGGWSSDSSKLAVASISGGDPALVIFDAPNGRREQTIEIGELDEIFNPTWNPEGTAIAFTGMTRGLTDLFVYELGTGELRRLTNDPYTDIQPAWSPDGRYIAMATDRFSSKLDVLDIGDYRLALVDPASGAVSQLAAFTTGKNINPQWSPDSQSLYFLSDRDGISNIYRATLAGVVTQITTVSTGVTGITATSPALSIASKTGVAAFSVYDGGSHHVYTLDVADRGQPLAEVETNAAILPPADRRASQIAGLIADASFGLPPEQEYATEDYSAGLSLEAVGPPVIGIGADRFGAAISGGLALFFSDLLGDQQLSAAFQLSAGLGGDFSARDSAAQVAYTNRKHRWNWGLLGGQVPYLSGGLRTTLDEIDGHPVIVDETILLRQTERSAAGLVAYPFNRAQRLEFQGGFSQLTFDRVTRTQAYSLVTGQLLVDERDTVEVAEPANLMTSSAAFVSDTSLFGATSPVQGERYRFEVAPTFGTIDYTSVLADYRRYVMPANFYTVAGRVLHYGRYGSGGDDDRMFPLFLGYPSLVRGYDVNSFAPEECVPDGASTCPAFDQLLGTRLLVANLEFRFPLLRPFGATQNMYGPLPVEVALFADGGVAWAEGEKPDLFGGSRKAVASAGVAFRVNVFGFMVAEFDVAKPFQRPEQGWMFAFHLTPGF
ncbi:MAG: BamA/TamA family outer membrane protein [Vicinamibacterales bacterium]